MSFNHIFNLNFKNSQFVVLSDFKYRNNDFWIINVPETLKNRENECLLAKDQNLKFTKKLKVSDCACISVVSVCRLSPALNMRL